jgi:hypothetical protein
MGIPQTKKIRAAVAAGLAVLGLAAFSSSAMAAGEAVSGTTTGSLSLAAGTGAVFASNFTPGGTATQTGVLTATDTSPSWTLQVKDGAASNAGHMQAAAVGCTGSDAALTNALTVNVTSVLSGVTSNGVTTIAGTNATVASATSALLAANVFTTSYSQSIPATQIMLAGCVYSLTGTYTLQ